MTAPIEVAAGVWLVRDTCNVYLVRSDAGTAIAIDFGSGLVLEHLEALGISAITDVLMTHHHRDQGQGLPLAVEHGARIHVPPTEVELFDRVEEMWATRQLDNDYNLRQDRFSLLESVPVASTVPVYREATYGGVTVRPLPTPGHTMGSVSYLYGDVAFTGDLIYAPGKVWSLAASQWSYSDHEGPAMTVLSCYLLQREQLATLLPSHGNPMEATPALTKLADTMQRYVDSRRSYPWDLAGRLENPFTQLTDHLLLNRTSMSCSYVLLSETGEALFVDFGYDMTTGIPSGNDRAGRLPWLASLPVLRERYGVTRVSVALPTHYHDDHMAGMPLLRDVEGTELWIPSNVAPIMADPWATDLPCQWYDPVLADRVLPVGESFSWNEYTITVHEQPGHTLYAAAFETVVDGVTVIFTGDQQEGLGGLNGSHEGRRDQLNYQYRNRFRVGDYIASAALYKRVAPGLMASGHWAPRWVEEGYLDYLADEGQFVADIHHELLPLDELDLDADSILVRLTPFRSRAAAGATLDFVASVKNPHRYAAEAVLKPIVPLGWRRSETVTCTIGAGETARIPFSVTVGTESTRRSRVAVDVTIGDLRLGQHAEAVVDVVEQK